MRVGTCGRNCQFCSGPSQCKQCYPPYSVVNGSCQCDAALGFLTATGCSPSCGGGEYFNATAKACLDCVDQYPNCQTCNMTNCLVCSIGFFLSLNSSGYGQCVKYCPANYTQMQISSGGVTQGVCGSCASNCSTCVPGLCLSCVPGFIYYQGRCVTACPVGYFPLNADCQRCPANCLYCNALACATCLPGFTLTAAGYCAPLCANTNTTATSTGSNCNLTCNSVCATCYGTLSTQCLSCSNSSLYFYNGTCLTTCSPGLYPVSAQCSSCPSTCATCTSQTTCLTCLPGYYFISSQCVRTCPSATFPNISSTNVTACLACPANCVRCGDAQTCFECGFGFITFNFTCNPQPPIGF